MNVLDLECGEDILHRHVVEAIPAPAHGLNDAVPLQHGLTGPVGIVRAGIADYSQCVRGMASTVKGYVTKSCLGWSDQSEPARDHASAWLSNMTSRESQLP
ncbi:MAG: hypothetical protein ACJ8AW_22580 [Rhodopila sp.]